MRNLSWKHQNSVVLYSTCIRSSGLLLIFKTVQRRRIALLMRTKKTVKSKNDGGNHFVRSAKRLQQPFWRGKSIRRRLSTIWTGAFNHNAKSKNRFRNNLKKHFAHNERQQNKPTNTLYGVLESVFIPKTSSRIIKGILLEYKEESL